MQKFQIIIPILLIAFVTLFSINLQDVYAGPGHGEPIIINLDGQQVGIDTKLYPLDISLGNFHDVTLSIQFYDVLTNQSFDDVTYLVEIWRDDELLARGLFFDYDGNLEVKIQPVADCEEIKKFKCTKYFGAKEPISGGYYDVAGVPVIKGPILIDGGIYTLKIEIVGAMGVTTQLVNTIKIQEQFSASQEQNFNISTTIDEFLIITKTYYELIDNFTFEEKQNSISFDMPFDWNPLVINHTKFVHQEIRVPKFVEAYAENTSFQGIVDGVELSERTVILDPYSYSDYNVLHFIVSNSDLKLINNKLGLEHYNKENIEFTLTPRGSTDVPSIIVNIDTGAKIGVSIIENSINEIDSMKFTFFDDNGKLLKNVRYGYEVLSNEDVIFTNTGNDSTRIGILAVDGIDIQNINFPSNGNYQIKLVLFEHGIFSEDQPNYGNGFDQGIIEIGDSFVDSQSSIDIPIWIKNNAGWWADGSIDDDSFVQGIQFLIKEDILKIPPTIQDSNLGSNEIPSWIKNNAGWWADGSIDDDSFVQGIQFLIKEGIINVS